MVKIFIQLCCCCSNFVKRKKNTKNTAMIKERRKRQTHTQTLKVVFLIRMGIFFLVVGCFFYLFTIGLVGIL